MQASATLLGIRHSLCLFPKRANCEGNFCITATNRSSNTRFDYRRGHPICWCGCAVVLLVKLALVVACLFVETLVGSALDREEKYLAMISLWCVDYFYGIV